jgi:D-glycero-D-manno-heptose 1,7-bisphosphate phosphatase
MGRLGIRRLIVIMLRPAVFLDRDGVLNQTVVVEGKPYPPLSVESFELIEGVPEGLQRLRAAGFLLIVVSNQPDIARKAQSEQAIEAMHEKLRSLVTVDDIRVCPHDSTDHCRCRKPLPGMILDAAREFGIALQSSYLVGDRWRDVDAGVAAGVKTIFIDYGYAEQLKAEPWQIVSTFVEAVTRILAHWRGVGIAGA